MNDRAKFDDPHIESLLPKVPFTRRGFIASSLASGFALAAGPIAAQTAIITPADGLDVGAALVPVSGGNLPVYFAAPKKAGKYATVIVVPEVFGMHEYQRDICRRLAKTGYYAITLDPFFRIGDLSKIADVKEVVGKANTLADDQMLSDLDALVAFVENQPKANTKKLGITGMCRGGRTVWMYTAHSNNQPEPARAAAHADRRRGQAERPGARALRRRRPGHPARCGRAHARRAGGLRQGPTVDDPRLRRHAPRLPRRLPRELSQGSRRRRLEAHARMVQEERGGLRTLNAEIFLK